MHPSGAVRQIPSSRVAENVSGPPTECSSVRCSVSNHMVTLLVATPSSTNCSTDAEKTSHTENDGGILREPRGWRTGGTNLPFLQASN